MGKIRADVAVHQNNLAVAQGCFQLNICLEAISCIKQRAEMRIDIFQRTQVSIQELPNHLAKPRIVLRETRLINRMAPGAQGLGQQFDLGTLAAAIDSLNGDQFSASSHFQWTAYRTSVDASLTWERRRCNATLVAHICGTM